MAQEQQSLSRTEVRQQASQALFAAASEHSNIPRYAWRLLATALAFFDAAMQIDARHAGRIARDMVLAAPFDDLSVEEQCIVASVLAFQRRKLRRQRETAFLRLKRRDRTLALQLAAMLRLADGLSEPGTLPVAAQREDGRTVLLIGGSLSAIDAHVERWRKAFGDLEIRAVAAHELAVPTSSDSMDEVGEIDMAGRDVATLNGDMLLHRAARRELRRLFEKMLGRARKVQRGDDPEDVHKMRVATRQLRAVLDIVDAAFAPDVIKECNKRLKRVARALGAVRDQDVLLQHVRAHREMLSEDAQSSLDPLEYAIEQKRAKARDHLLAELHSKRYKKFVHQFATFLTSPEAGLAEPPLTGVPPRVRDGAGSLVWQRYEELRAFEAVMLHADDVTLHHARIAGKRLRYALEFFAEALGPQANEQITLLTNVQDMLGSLHDGTVASELVTSLGMADDAGAQGYLTARAAEGEQLRGELPTIWNKIVSRDTRCQLADMLVDL